MKRMPVLTVIVGCLVIWFPGCAANPSKRDVADPYQTWDNVITRWIGGKTEDLYLEIGPPNLHPQELADGGSEMVWDFGIDRMPGQADYYDLFPLYGVGLNCQIHFIADAKGIVREGNRIGCE